MSSLVDTGGRLRPPSGHSGPLRPCGSVWPRFPDRRAQRAVCGGFWATLAVGPAASGSTCPVRKRPALSLSGKEARSAPICLVWSRGLPADRQRCSCPSRGRTAAMTARWGGFADRDKESPSFFRGGAGSHGKAELLLCSDFSPFSVSIVTSTQKAGTSSFFWKKSKIPCQKWKVGFILGHTEEKADCKVGPAGEGFLHERDDGF